MIVTEELRISVPEDIPIYARAQAFRRVVRNSVRREPGVAESALRCAETVPILVVEALGAEVEREVVRLRQAELVLDLVRLDVWTLYRRGRLAASGFDAVMLAAAACHREVRDMISRARHRAWAGLHGGAWANASSRRATSEKNSRSSQSR